MKAASLRELEPDFWRAPSAHNSQPWLLRYDRGRDDAVEIGWDPARALPAGDPTGRDLRLGMGAFAETCLIVCADAGLNVAFHPGYSEPDRRIGRLAAADEPYPTPFTAEDVRNRRSGRGAYEPGRLDDPTVAALDELAAAEGARIRRLPCRALMRPLYDADRHLFGTPPIARELRGWLRLSPRDPRYDQDGLTDRALGLRRMEALGLRAALSRAGYPALRRAGLPRMLAASSRAVLDYDGEVLVLVAPPLNGTDRPDRQVALGRVLMRQWLTLSELGHTTHPLSQIIDAQTTREALARLLDVDEPARLLSVFRAGRPATPVPRSARRR